MKHCCDEMNSHLLEQKVGIKYIPKFREYGIELKSTGTSAQLIKFCPWCGCRLPTSLREQWFDLLDELKLEPGDEDIPTKMLTDEWWNN